MGKEVKLSVRPIGEMILVETISKNATASGIALPEGADIGETEVYVRAVGSKVNPELGIMIDNKVLLSRHHGGLQEVGGAGNKKFFVVKHDAVVAVVE